MLLSCCYLCLCALQGHKSSWALLLLKIDALYWHILLFLAQKALCYILCLSRGWFFHTWRSRETSRKFSTSIWRSWGRSLCRRTWTWLLHRLIFLCLGKTKSFQMVMSSLTMINWDLDLKFVIYLWLIWKVIWYPVASRFSIRRHFESPYFLGTNEVIRNMVI